MMVSVVRIGNSRGIRIPQKILSGLNIQDKVEMVIHKDELIIKNMEKKTRQGWNEAFAKMSEVEADKLIMPENIDSGNFEWVW